MTDQLPRVLITGSSRGLGLAMARDLATTHRVIGVARGPAPADAPFTHRAGIDVNDDEQLASLADDLATCDVLINNVGLAHDGILATQSHDAIEDMINVNLTSVLKLTKLYLRQRIALGKPGNVISISSIVSQRGYRGLAVYSATKGALNAMTRALAREMGAKNFRINAVLPGFIETDLSAGLEDGQRQQIVRRTPLGRLGTVADVTPLIRFLISDEARFITGQEFVVDGGLTA